MKLRRAPKTGLKWRLLSGSESGRESEILMQSLSEFRAEWQPMMRRQMAEMATKVEAGQNMFRFLALEAVTRPQVDALVREYSEGLAVAPKNLTADLGYLLHLRLQEGLLFGQFLDSAGFGTERKTASEWIQFLAIGSWHEVLVFKWAQEFFAWYGPKE